MATFHWQRSITVTGDAGHIRLVAGWYDQFGSSHPRHSLLVPTGVPMLYKTMSAAVYGIDASIIVPEVNAREAAMVNGLEVPSQIAAGRYSFHQFRQRRHSPPGGR